MKVLLDTNAYSALRRGQELVVEHVRNSEEVLLSMVVVGELLYGFRNGSRHEENARALGSFVETVMEIPTELVPAVRELIARHGR